MCVCVCTGTRCGVPAASVQPFCRLSGLKTWAQLEFVDLSAQIPECKMNNINFRRGRTKLVSKLNRHFTLHCRVLTFAFYIKSRLFFWIGDCICPKSWLTKCQRCRLKHKYKSNFTWCSSLRRLQNCYFTKFGDPEKASLITLGCYQGEKRSASKMRLSPPNIIMHKSIILLQQHRKQCPALTFTIYTVGVRTPT